jgi:hypothetical protein
MAPQTGCARAPDREIAVKIAPARQIETTYAAAEQHLGQPRRVGHRHENDFAAQFAAPFRLAE